MLTSLVVFFILCSLLSTHPWLIHSLTKLSVLDSGGLSISANVSSTFNTILFSAAVLFIAAMVMAYSESYMESDKYLTRFIMLVILFVSSMLILIFSDSWLMIILGWDGLGLSSYFLVVFYLNPSSNSGGLITVLSNRVGDIFIVLFIVLSLNILSEGGTPSGGLMMASGLIFLAAITKSAMFPFMSWLPEAMAAPTPVSSLVHSSTLVTAGVFLLLQMAHWVLMTPLMLLMVVSTISLAGSSMTAMVSMDNKKIVALSTLSQLSLMMLSLSAGLPALAFFHLISHAMFKSCLFLSVGAAMHMSGASQEARGKSGSGQWAAISVMGISLLSLSAAPFTSAYYTKESILLMSMTMSVSKGITYLLIISAIFTMLYSTRFMFSNLLSAGSGVSKLFDGPVMHLFTVGLVGFSVTLGVMISGGSSSPYLMNYSLLAIVLMFILVSFSLAGLSGVKAVSSVTHFNMGLKQVFTMAAPITTSTPISLNMMKWEMGALSALGVSAWSSAASTSSGFVIFMGRSLFSTHISTPLIIILIIMVAY